MDKYNEIRQLPALQFFRFIYCRFQNVHEISNNGQKQTIRTFPWLFMHFSDLFEFRQWQNVQTTNEIRTPIYQYAIYYSHANGLSDGYCCECYTATNELFTELTRWAGGWGDHPPMVWRRTMGLVQVGDVFLRPYSPQADERKKNWLFQ